MTTISDQITSLANATTQLQAKTDTLTGSASANLNQSDFLKLLTQQLQFQDPMAPQDNSQFISQMAQFSQLEATSNMDKNLSAFAGEMKATSLVGQNVVLTDPKDSTKVINGPVEAAYIDGADSAVTVNGTNYPLKYLLYSYQDTGTDTGTGTPTGTTGTTSTTSSSGATS